MSGNLCWWCGALLQCSHTSHEGTGPRSLHESWRNGWRPRRVGGRSGIGGRYLPPRGGGHPQEREKGIQRPVVIEIDTPDNSLEAGWVSSDVPLRRYPESVCIFTIHTRSIESQWRGKSRRKTRCLSGETASYWRLGARAAIPRRPSTRLQKRRHTQDGLVGWRRKPKDFCRCRAVAPVRNRAEMKRSFKSLACFCRASVRVIFLPLRFFLLSR